MNPFLFVVDSRDHYGIHWAVTAEKCRPTLPEAVALAVRRVKESGGKPQFIHRHKESKWILVKKVTA